MNEKEGGKGRREEEGGKRKSLPRGPRIPIYVTVSVVNFLWIYPPFRACHVNGSAINIA